MHFQYCSVALQYCSLLVILGILVLANAHGGRSAISRIVVRYALCPLATPAQFKGDGGDNQLQLSERTGQDPRQASEVREIGEKVRELQPRIRVMR